MDHFESRRKTVNEEHHTEREIECVVVVDVDVVVDVMVFFFLCIQQKK